MLLYFDKCQSFEEFSSIIFETLIKTGTKTASANIIVADPDIYDNYYLDGAPTGFTVSHVNNLDRINVTLVESLSELLSILVEHFRRASSGEITNLPQIDQNTRVIGLYGVFEYFLKRGNELIAESIGKESGDLYGKMVLSNREFMERRDFSAKTINYICYIMHNLAYYRKYEIYLNDPHKESTELHAQYRSAIWNKSLPNLQPAQHTTTEDQRQERDTTDNGVQENRRILLSDDLNADANRTSKINCIKSDDIPEENKVPIDMVPLGLVLSKWIKLYDVANCLGQT